MPVPFIMPKFDMDQEKATIISWSKKEGDFIKLDETVLTVETEKVAIDVPAPASGTLAGILYKEGDVVPVTRVIAYILKEGETATDLPKIDSAAVPAASKPVPAPAATAPAGSSPMTATPVAARMAREEGIDLSRVPASGEKITREDVEQYLARQEAAGRVTVAATPSARRIARESGVPIETVPGTGPRGRVQAADVKAHSSPAITASINGRQAEIVELNGIRRTIAERMQTSFQTIPHIALSIEVDVSSLERSRANLNALAEKHSGDRISLTVLLIAVTAWALKRNPYINASLIDGRIHLWKDINIGIATAIDDGLIVPVLRAADQKSIRQLADDLQDLALRAREGRLGLRDVQAGTFTISNLGMYGIDHFRAIINPPESAILAVGSVTRKPVVINGRDEVAVRPMMSITISADHRVIDGVVAARFLQDLAGAIETPESLIY